MASHLALHLAALLSLFAPPAAGGAVPANDWPAYGHDNTRSGVTAQELQLPLREAWSYEAPHPPSPAWPAPAENDYWHKHRKLRPVITHDRAFHAVIAEGLLFFGSSADDKVVALDAATGRERWSFFTGGPVRLAPATAGGNLYAGSDDGAVYAIDARTGKLLWKFSVENPVRLLPGNGRMISRQPVRAGLVVADGKVYFGAGLFPREGTFLFALDARTGALLWKREARFSLQGYMLASPSRLYVPTGRSQPVAFSRSDGKYLGEFGSAGGAYALLVNDVLVTGPGRGQKEIDADDVKTGETIASFGGLRMVIRGTTAYMQSETSLSAFDRGRYLLLARERKPLEKQKEAAQKRLKALPKDAAEAVELRSTLEGVDAEIARLTRAMKACTLWKTGLACPYCLVLAGDTLLAGGDGKIVALRAADGRKIWSAPVDGKAYGMSLAAGRLYASTDKGILHCFSPDAPARPRRIRGGPAPGRRKEAAQPKSYGRTVDGILSDESTGKGYCLVLGCEEGELALEIARRTKLQVVCIEDDPRKVEACRRRIDEAGVYGTRVSVQEGPLDRLPYPDYFANLVVSERTLARGTLPTPLLEVFRVLRPFGGTACIGRPEGGAAAETLTEAKLADWLREAPVPGARILQEDGLWTVVRRGPLPGGGTWTHLYATAGNTVSSGDVLRGPLAIQWFGEPGPRHILDRHHRPMAPLFAAGRLFVPGDNRITAVDAYNGSLLWHLEVPDSRRIGVMKDCGQMVAAERSVFVAAGDECWRIDARSGKRAATYEVPAAASAPQEWGYLNVENGRIIGSAQAKGASFHVLAFHGSPLNACEILEGDFREVIQSRSLFALDEKTSERKWQYREGAVMNSTIAMDGGRIFFAECRDPEVAGDADGRIRIDRFCRRETFLTALDAATGAPCWQREMRFPFQHIFFAACARGTLVCSGSYNESNHVRYALLAFRADTGKTLWKTNYLAMDINGTKPARPGGAHGEQWQHPVINGTAVYLKPHAFDLATGEKLPYEWLRGGHGCGGVSSSARYLFGRGSTPRYYPLDADRSTGIQLTEVTRPGCWINIVPAGGLVLIPESSSGCTCAYAVQTSLAFAPRAYYGPPCFLTRTRVFEKTLRVALASANGCGEVRYTLDGSEPTRESPLYSAPVELTATTTVAARTFWGSGKTSSAARATFTRR